MDENFVSFYSINNIFSYLKKFNNLVNAHEIYAIYILVFISINLRNLNAKTYRFVAISANNFLQKYGESFSLINVALHRVPLCSLQWKSTHDPRGIYFNNAR
ncbi:hypothetical protein PUN28_018621 [Cardiocondyla obscurior]|uniref:Uncharacterized protein n=1 Tax=Cardiocondyla obscurior TaxID=286306 RepID=A0AAW2EH04_9HYME